MKFRLLFLWALLMVAACFAASTNHIQTTDHASTPAAGTNDPVALEYQKLMEDDDAALLEIDGWIRENQRYAEQGAGVPPDELNRRIIKRIEPVRAAYEDFLQRNPNHANAHLAYASFLENIHEEEAALGHMLKAKEVDPKNPAAWNNLANYYGHFSPVTNAFYHYERAIELNPMESVYYHNFGTVVFLFRRDVMSYYGINEQQVFDKALGLYSNAMRLDPTNFLLATDVAMTYYGIKPARTDDALKSWADALKLAEGSLQREGVQIHLARVQSIAGRYDEARSILSTVTNAELADLKSRVLRNLELKEHPPAEPATNASPALATNAPPAIAPVTNTASAKP